MSTKTQLIKSIDIIPKKKTMKMSCMVNIYYIKALAKHKPRTYYHYAIAK